MAHMSYSGASVTPPSNLSDADPITFFKPVFDHIFSVHNATDDIVTGATSAATASKMVIRGASADANFGFLGVTPLTPSGTQGVLVSLATGHTGNAYQALYNGSNIFAVSKDGNVLTPGSITGALIAGTQSAITPANTTTVPFVAFAPLGQANDLASFFVNSVKLASVSGTGAISSASTITATGGLIGTLSRSTASQASPFINYSGGFTGSGTPGYGIALLSGNYQVTSGVTSLQLGITGYGFSFNYGVGGSVSPVAAVGGMNGFISSMAIENVGSDGNSEFSSYTSFLRSDTGNPGTTCTTPGRYWGADNSIQGPIGVRPQALAGIHMFINNYYDGSPAGYGTRTTLVANNYYDPAVGVGTTGTDDPSGDFWAVTMPGNGGGGSSFHYSATTYRKDVGIGIVGYSGAPAVAYASATPGYTVGLQIGGRGSNWSVPFSHIRQAINIQDISLYGVNVQSVHPTANSATRAIRVAPLTTFGPVAGVAIGATSDTTLMSPVLGVVSGTLPFTLNALQSIASFGFETLANSVHLGIYAKRVSVGTDNFASSGVIIGLDNDASQLAGAYLQLNADLSVAFSGSVGIPGTLALGGAVNPIYGVLQTGGITGGGTLYGYVQTGLTLTPTANAGSIVGANFGYAVATASFSPTNAYGIIIGNITKTGGGTVTNAYGLYVFAPLIGSTLNVLAKFDASAVSHGQVCTIGGNGHLSFSSDAAPATSGLLTNVTSAVFTGNDQVALLTIVTSNTIATASTVCTVTYAAAFNTAPSRVILVPADSATWALAGTAQLTATTIGATTFLVKSGSTSPAAGTYTYSVIAI